jgi:hypothetical protein
MCQPHPSVPNRVFPAEERYSHCLAGSSPRSAWGTRCFGKGSVQTVIPAARQRSLYGSERRTPSGRPIQGLGNVPDLSVAETRQEVPSHHRWLDVSMKCPEHGGTRTRLWCPAILPPGRPARVVPYSRSSVCPAFSSPRHIRIPRCDSVQKAILPATREVYVARTTCSRKLRKTNRTRNSSGGRQARKRCAGCDRTGSLEICGARMVRATAQPADTRDLSRTATT